jgi:hypothetical protein
MLKVGDFVICSKRPGVRFEIMHIMGTGDLVQYRLKDAEDNWFGYVGPESLKKLSNDL